MIVKYLLKIAMLGSSWVMYVLLALSVASIAAMVERFFYFRRRGDGEEMGDELCRPCSRRASGRKPRRCSSPSPTIEAEVLRASLRWAAGGPRRSRRRSRAR